MIWRLIIILMLMMDPCRFGAGPSSFCGVYVRRYAIWLDVGMEDWEEVEISRAVRAWNVALRGVVKLEIKGNHFGNEVCGVRIWRCDGKNFDDEVRQGYLGWCNRIGGEEVVLLMDRIGHGMLFGVMMHELGHILGLCHGSGIMVKDFQNGWVDVDIENAETVIWRNIL